MKTRIIGTLSALALVLGIGVGTATTAQADTRFGPFITAGACAQSQSAYSNAGWRIVSACYSSRVYGNTWRYFFRAI